MPITLPRHRLAKWIAQNGYCSRRSAKRLISNAQVSCNGRLALHTDLVNHTDIILIDGVALPPMPQRQYWLYHKPVGIDCNNRPHDPASLYHLLKTLPERVFAVGRLDKDSSGLLLLTNDGELSQQLMHPDFYHEKTYLVETDKPLTAEFITAMAAGVSWQLGEKRYQSRPCQVSANTSQQFTITLTQGLHRQIRYMCKALGYRVTTLKRVRLHNLILAQLPVGELRQLSIEELTQLRTLSKTPQPGT